MEMEPWDPGGGTLQGIDHQEPRERRYSHAIFWSYHAVKYHNTNMLFHTYIFSHILTYAQYLQDPTLHSFQNQTKFSHIYSITCSPYSFTFIVSHYSHGLLTISDITYSRMHALFHINTQTSSYTSYMYICQDCPRSRQV